MKRAGILWTFRAVGLVTVRVGVYIAGGEELPRTGETGEALGISPNPYETSSVTAWRLHAIR